MVARPCASAVRNEAAAASGTASEVCVSFINAREAESVPAGILLDFLCFLDTASICCSMSFRRPTPCKCAFYMVQPPPSGKYCRMLLSPSDNLEVLPENTYSCDSIGGASLPALHQLHAYGLRFFSVHQRHLGRCQTYCGDFRCSR